VKQKQCILESLTGSNLEDLGELESQHSVYEEDEPRRPVRVRRPPFNINSNDFRVGIPKFEGKLDLKEFLNWLSTVERVFEYS